MGTKEELQLDRVQVRVRRGVVEKGKVREFGSHQPYPSGVSKEG
jgi:hypothetical protein